MKKFKKLAAVMVAVVTLMATTINACAAIVNDETYYWFNQLKATYYLANNTIHYSDLLKNRNNNIYFTNVDSRLMEGNIVLSVDFSDPDSEWRDIPESLITGHMSKLHLRDEKTEKYILEGKYPLTVNYNAPGDYINVMVDTNRRVFENVEVNKVNLAYKGSYSKDKAFMEVICYIKDFHVLPGYILTLEECNSSSPVKLTKQVEISVMYNATDYKSYYDGDYTFATFRFYDFPYNKYKGKTFDVKINGIKVGKISLASNQCKITITEK